MHALTVIIALIALLPLSAIGKTLNGFEIVDPLIPVDEIVSGGPPRDGIPAINEPLLVDASDVEFMDDDDRLMGVVIDDEARAYPIKILDWHEVVNDRIDSQHYAVTYCPLCGSGIVFASNAGEGHLVFGVSGLLYDSDVLLFDRNSESLWSQLMGKAISGPLKGTELPQIPARHTTWKDWFAQYPESLVMSTETGFNRNYERSPYINYTKTRRLYFDVSNKAPRGLHTKEMVLGIRVGDTAKAYPFSSLAQHGESSFEDRIGDVELTVHWREEAQTAWATDADGIEVPTTIAYWFAWYTFNPQTLLFEDTMEKVQ